MSKIATAAAFLKAIFDMVYATGSSLADQYDIVRLGNDYFLVRADAKTCNYNVKSARRIQVKLITLDNWEEDKLRKKFNIE